MLFEQKYGFGEMLEERLKAGQSYFLLSQFCGSEEVENCNYEGDFVFNSRFIFNKLMKGPRHYKFAVEFINGYISRFRQENISYNYQIDAGIENTNHHYKLNGDINTVLIAFICLRNTTFCLYKNDTPDVTPTIIYLISGDLFLFDSTLSLSGKLNGLIIFLSSHPILPETIHEQPHTTTSRWSTLFGSWKLYPF